MQYELLFDNNNIQVLYKNKEVKIIQIFLCKTISIYKINIITNKFYIRNIRLLSSHDATFCVVSGPGDPYTKSDWINIVNQKQILSNLCPLICLIARLQHKMQRINPALTKNQPSSYGKLNNNQ